MREVVLADFGLAATVLSSISGSSRQSLGAGTLYYMVRTHKNSCIVQSVLMHFS